MKSSDVSPGGLAVARLSAHAQVASLAALEVIDAAKIKGHRDDFVARAISRSIDRVADGADLRRAQKKVLAQDTDGLAARLRFADRNGARELLDKIGVTAEQVRQFRSDL